MGKVITYEIIKEFIEEKSESGCTLLTSKKEFSDEIASNNSTASHIKLKINCKCGNSFIKSYNNFSHKSNPQQVCKECGAEKRNLKNGTSYNVIKKFIEDETLCILLTNEHEFEQVRKKQKLYHVKVPLKLKCYCGSEFESNFYNFKSNKKTSCFNCGKKRGGTKRFTFEFIDKYIGDNGCELLTTKQEFEDRSKEEWSSSIELEIQCRCGEIFLLDFNRFKNTEKHQCNSCSMSKIIIERSFSYLMIKDKIESVGCELLTKEQEFNQMIKNKKISSSLVKLKILCKECNTRTFERSFSVFNRPSHYCLECSNRITNFNRRKTHDEYLNEVNEKFGDCEYTVLEKYETCDTKLMTRHNSNKCRNYEWYVSPTSLLSGTGCPVCRETKGELAIRNFLIDNNIKFLAQYEFKDLKSDLGIPLKFDFAVFNFENKIILLIEYDGKQHYEHIESWITKEKYERMKIHDNMKNEYCKNNQILLLRIPYWDFDNIKEILNQKLISNKIYTQ